MRDDTEGAFIAAALAYPRSIAAALFSPRRLVGSRAASESCPPLLALAISLGFYFAGDGIVSRVELGAPGGVDFPSLGKMVAILLWIAVVLAAARSTLSRLFGLRSSPPFAGLVALLWVINTGLLADGLVAVVAVWFPQATVSFATILDSGYANMPDSWTFPMIWTHAVATVSAPIVLVVCFWALFNAVRSAFEVTLARAVAATGTTMLVCLIVTLLFGTVTHAITRQLFVWVNPG